VLIYRTCLRGANDFVKVTFGFTFSNKYLEVFYVPAVVILVIAIVPKLMTCLDFS
jgi:hypothetical protein